MLRLGPISGVAHFLRSIYFEESSMVGLISMLSILHSFRNRHDAGFAIFGLQSDIKTATGWLQSQA